jgi:DNA-directed RNA polymerase specialized sigma24 family protein
MTAIASNLWEALTSGLVPLQDVFTILVYHGWDEQEAGHLLAILGVGDCVGHLEAYLEDNYDRLFRFSRWRVEGYCMAPGVDEDGQPLDSRSIPFDIENAAANTMAKAWRRLSLRKGDKLRSDYLFYARFGRGHDWTLRAVWRQAIKAVVRGFRQEFMGSGFYKMPHPLLGDYNPADNPTREVDMDPFWLMFGALNQDLAKYVAARYLPVLQGETPKTAEETADALGLSKRTVMYRASELRGVADLFAAMSF